MTRNTRLRSLCLAALCATAACSNDSTAPIDPATETRWDADLTIRFVRASGESACDGTNILGAINPGEFQYRIAASFGTKTETTQSTNYGTVNGTSHDLSTTETYNFTNQTWTFNNLKLGDAVKLDMWATEWDGVSKDDYLNNMHASLNVVPSSLLPSGGTRIDRALGVGKTTCGLTVIFDVTVRTRVVSVS